MHAQVCKPNGYFPVADPEHNTDVWALCVPRLVGRLSEGSPQSHDILYDQPLGWWDPEWLGAHGAPGCFTNDAPVHDSYFEARAPLMRLHLRAALYHA